MFIIRKTLNDCKSVETKARSDNSDASKFLVTSHVESITLKSHNIKKSCCHGGDLEGNDIRRLMSKGAKVFEDAASYLNENKICITVEISIR